MKKRVIHEQQIVDIETGEVKIITSSTLRGNDESFIMGRTTAGLTWMKGMSILELQMIMVFVHNKNRKDNLVVMPKSVLEDVCVEFEVAYKTLTNTLNRMRQRDVIKQVKKNVYMVNPLTFYSGGTNNWKNMYEEYNSVKDILY
jgi:hypothetical protein